MRKLYWLWRVRVRQAGMAEQEDAQDLKFWDIIIVRVRISLSALLSLKVLGITKPYSYG